MVKISTLLNDILLSTDIYEKRLNWLLILLSIFDIFFSKKENQTTEIKCSTRAQKLVTCLCN